jgi:pantothenate kinase
MQIPEIIFPASLAVTDQTIDISGFTTAQKTFYLNLFCETVQIYETMNKPRVAIGVAGPTGAGKSVLAVLFKELAKQVRLPFAFEVITIDAYHFPNSYLLSRQSNGVPLKQVKGRFDTYDVQALARDLKSFASGGPIGFPVYSRRLHDPVPNSILITSQATLLLVEGLWLLSNDGDWSRIRPLLEYCYFVDSDKERTRNAVIKRHMTGGRSLGRRRKTLQKRGRE